MNITEPEYKFENLNIKKIGIENQYLLDLLKRFFNSSPKYCFKKKSFFYHFKNSLGSNYKINNINDFNIDIFNTQVDYFIKTMPIGRATMLKDFYTFLLDNPNFKSISYLDGIDEVMLNRKDFFDIYLAGYRLVAYNPIEKFPQHNKWLIMPNGFEYNSTVIYSEKYFKLDFEDLRFKKYTDILKQWFWQDTNNLETRCKDTKIVIKFLNLIYDLRKNNNSQVFTNNSDDLYINASEIYIYMNHLRTLYNNDITKSHYVYPVNKFLKFIDSQNLATVEPSCYIHLVSRYKQKTRGGQDIPDESLIKLEKHLREKSNNSYSNTLNYALFHLALSTEFRISQITSLKIDCIKETMKEGQYLIKSNTKVSNGDIVEQHISSYTKRLLDDIIAFTQKTRDNCSNKNLHDYIFLSHVKNNIYKKSSEASFNHYLSKSCKEIGLPIYYSGNLRDTYMTKAKEYALKKGLSMIQLSSLTKHKSINTTNNHYVNEKIRDYLEATHSVVIGNVDLKGKILSSLNKKIEKDNIVDDGCGYCSNSACNLFNNLDCPMCSGFIVTLDRIPYYENKINKINMQLSSEKILHEKEHLQSIKRLYLAYLEKLYQLKQELEDNKTL